LADFNARWKRLRDNLQRAGLAPDNYLSVIDINVSTGRLHRHVIALGSNRLTRRQLDDQAGRAGLGRIDYELVGTTQRDARDLAAYVAKNALHYAISLAGSPNPIRPVTRSRTKGPRSPS
jgi:hypothetical protein